MYTCGGFILIFGKTNTITKVAQRRRQWHPTPVLLPGKSHGRRSLIGCSPWGREELDTTKRLHFHFSLSCIGEGNGSPLQRSCLENPRDGGAWWAAVYGVSQSRTQLKRLSSSSSRDLFGCYGGGMGGEGDSGCHWDPVSSGVTAHTGTAPPSTESSCPKYRLATVHAP